MEKEKINGYLKDGKLVLENIEDVETVSELIDDEDNFILVSKDCAELIISSNISSLVYDGEVKIVSKKE